VTRRGDPRAVSRIGILAILLTACSGGGGSAAAGAATAGDPAPAAVDPGPPVTLRLAIAGVEADFVGTFVHDLVQRVALLSGGNVTITPKFGAGDDTSQGFEAGVADLVKRGDADLGLTASRVWDVAGTTSLQAFQTPFLIDNDALTLAVANSDIVKRALDGMTSAGVVGLAMWPEALRHLFWFPQCGKDFSSLAGIAGATVVAVPSDASRLLVEALGGTVYPGPDSQRAADVQACHLQGMETNTSGLGLPAIGAAASNVVLFPKFDALVANTGALGRLSTAQSDSVRQAAAAAQATAIEHYPSEPATAAQSCANGGRFVRATDDDVAAMVKAADPVYGVLERDVLTKGLIEDIRNLKALTPASAAASECGGAPVPAASGATTDATGYTGTMIPNGVYRANLTEEGLIAGGATPEWAAANAGVYTWAMRGGKIAWGRGQGCDGTYQSVNGEYVRVDINGAGECDNHMDLLWKVDGDGIRFATIHLDGISAQDYKDIALFMDRIWTKIE
jgi:TRAP-type C4-dicarboxylate transport system substrate-binding protein